MPSPAAPAANTDQNVLTPPQIPAAQEGNESAPDFSLFNARSLFRAEWT
jgi:hypothetical protein